MGLTPSGSTNCRNWAQRGLRTLGLLSAADALRCKLQALRLRGQNQAFAAANPDVAFPPAELLYEIGGRLGLQRYLETGRESSEFLLSHFERYSHATPDTVLDWGCGVSCVCRQLRTLLPSSTQLVACDINSAMIDWAKSCIPDINYFHSQLLPPLPLKEASVDWAYGLSVFTHLSMEAFDAWLSEFSRIIKTGGLFVFTINSPTSNSRLLKSELEELNKTGHLILDGVKEGRKMYLAYHHPVRLAERIENARSWEILDFTPRGMKVTFQDLITLRRKAA